MIAVNADTPCYVLMEGKRRIGPRVVPPPAGMCLPIYGFSDKVSFDAFRANSNLELTPFPLVKDYLQGQTEMRGTELKLVVVDASGPRAPLLDAATMEAVLDAQTQRKPHVTATHQLTFDRDTDAYRVDEASA